MSYQTELMRAILTNETAKRIIKFVSPLYGDSYVGLWLFQAIGTALSDVSAMAENLRHETNPATATLLLDLWERQYGVATDSSLTPEQRRARIIAKMQFRGSCNAARLAAAVSAALGGAPVEVTENVAKNTFIVTVPDSFESIADTLAPAAAVIERMKPAHLLYRLMVIERIVATSQTQVAVAMTHAERFTVTAVMPVVEGLELGVYGETLSAYNYGAYVSGETLIMPETATVDGDVVIIQ